MQWIYRLLSFSKEPFICVMFNLRYCFHFNTCLLLPSWLRDTFDVFFHNLSLWNTSHVCAILMPFWKLNERMNMWMSYWINECMFSCHWWKVILLTRWFTIPIHEKRREQHTEKWKVSHQESKWGITDLISTNSPIHICAILHLQYYNTTSLLYFAMNLSFTVVFQGTIYLRNV